MAERTIKTKMQLIGGDEYVAGIEKITAALRKASEAKKSSTPYLQRHRTSQNGIGFV